MTRAALFALSALLGAAPASATVTIGGAFVHQETLSADDIAKLPHVAITATEHDGSTSHYAGVPLKDLLRGAGAPTGGDVKGAPARSYLAVQGSDGYVALYSLAEVDTVASDCAPILADQRNGNGIDPSFGPFRVVAPCDRTHARWVEHVTSLTIVTIPDHKQ